MRIALITAVSALAALAGCNPSAESQAAKAKPDSNVALNAAILAARPLPKEAALKLMHDRHENMEKIRDAMKLASREVKAGSPDLGVIRSSATTMARLAAQVPSWFPPGTGPDIGKTMAKPEIWQRPADFNAKAKAFGQSAKAFEAAARAGEMPAIQASFAALGKTCKACHDDYRNEHKK